MDMKFSKLLNELAQSHVVDSFVSLSVVEILSERWRNRLIGFRSARDGRIKIEAWK